MTMTQSVGAAVSGGRGLTVELSTVVAAATQAGPTVVVRVAVALPVPALVRHGAAVPVRSVASCSIFDTAVSSVASTGVEGPTVVISAHQSRLAFTVPVAVALAHGTRIGGSATVPGLVTAIAFIIASVIAAVSSSFGPWMKIPAVVITTLQSTLAVTVFVTVPTAQLTGLVC